MSDQDAFITNLQRKRKIWHWFSMIGVFGLLLWILLWNALLAPKALQALPLSFELALLLLPLAFLVRGILYGKVSTHAYASFAAIFYMFIGFWFTFTPDEMLYGLLILGFSSCLYFGGFFYARLSDVINKAIEQASDKQ
jgi:uncharacterized membrane protein